MDFNAFSSIVEDEEPCEDGPDCKFSNRGDAKGRVNPKPANSKAKKGKKAAPLPSRSFTRPSPANGKYEAPPSPLKGSEEEGLEKKGATCDEERTFLVRVRPGMAEAEVMFLNNAKGDGWEGPFDLKAPLQSLLDFDLLPLPRRAGVWKDRASSDAKAEETRPDESVREERTPPVRPKKKAASEALIGEAPKMIVPTHALHHLHSPPCLS
jgi:hypothetical protein